MDRLTQYQTTEGGIPYVTTVKDVTEQDALQKLARLEDAESKGQLLILPKESHQPMFVKWDALNTFNKWNDTTGAISDGTSWYYEMQGVIEEIAAMAFGAGIFYESEKALESEGE